MANFFDYKNNALLEGKLKTKILYENNAIESVAKYAKQYLSSGDLAIYYSEKDEALISQIERILLANNFGVYKVSCKQDSNWTTEKAASLMDLHTKYRFIIAVGDETIIDTVKYASNARHTSYGVVATSCASASLLSGKLTILGDLSGIVCEPPSFLLLDSKVLQNAQRKMWASCIGVILAVKLGIFEYTYSVKILGENYRDYNYYEALLVEIDEFFRSDCEYEKEQAITEMMLRLNVATLLLGDLISVGALAYADLVTQKYGRHLGENLFIATYALNLLYMNYLAEHKADTLIPPDYSKTAKLLDKNFGISYNKNRLLNDGNNYLKRAYLIEEYRQELYITICRYDILSATKRFRRCYNDAGYHLREVFTAGDLLSIMSLAGSMADRSLLGHIKSSGLLEEYII